MSTQRTILLLGGTGRVGKQVLTDSLARGHKVIALVRKPDSLATQTNLTLVTGSPTSSADILKALTTISDSSSATKPKVTIVSTLGQTRANPSNPWSAPTSPPLYMSQSAQAVVDALRDIETSSASSGRSDLNVEVEKFIVLSAFGTGDSYQYLHWVLKLVMWYSNMRFMVEDHDEIIKIVQRNFVQRGDDSADEKLRVSSLVVRPAMLKFDQVGELPSVKEYGHGQTGMGMMLGCDVRSLSLFLLDRVEDGRLDGTMPVVST